MAVEVPSGLHMKERSKEQFVTDQNEAGLLPVGAEGAQLKQKITNEKIEAKAEKFDPGMAMLGTDNEAGAMPDAEGMALARKAPKP